MKLKWLFSVLLGLIVLVACGESVPAVMTVAGARAIRGAVTLEFQSSRSVFREEIRIPDQAAIESGVDSRAVLELDNGAWVLLDRATRVRDIGVSSVSPVEGVLRLDRGRLWVDLSHADRTRIVTRFGLIRGSETGFSVRMTEDFLEVYCGSGELTYESEGGSGSLQQGMRVTLRGAAAPEEADVELWDDWTGGLADPSQSILSAPRLGMLSGRTQGLRGVARRPLPVRTHRVDVEIRGDFAVTQVEQTFFNAESSTLEALWQARIPTGALVERVEVDLGDGQGLRQGQMHAFAVAPNYALTWKPGEGTPFRLSYDGPERLRAHFGSVASGNTVRVRLRYTEWLARSGNQRTYRYPMHLDGPPPLLGEFILEANVAQDETPRLAAGLGAEVDEGQVTLRRSDYRPQADFVLTIDEDESREDDLIWAYEGTAVSGTEEDSESYVFFDIPTDRWMDEGLYDAEPLDLVIALDVSGATDPESLEVARAIVETVLRQLTPQDRVTLRLVDVRAHLPEGLSAELLEATEAHREAMLASIAEVHLGGATNLARSLRESAALLTDRPRGVVLYLGDGSTTTGAMDVSAIRAHLETLESLPRFFSLAIGDGSNLGLLRGISDGGAFQVNDRASASRLVMRMLADAAMPMLRDVRIHFGDAVERVYPRGPLSWRLGKPLRVMGRLVSDLPSEVRVTASLDHTPFDDQTYRVVVRELDDSGDIRRRWASARLAELMDAHAGREAIVDLGLRFRVLTPWTSLALEDSVQSGQFLPVQDFDHDPITTAWAHAGGMPPLDAPDIAASSRGWRRSLVQSADSWPSTSVEQTWVSRVRSEDPDAVLSGDGGLMRAAILRALRAGRSGPQACYDRRAVLRPDLRGAITVRVEVTGRGRVEGIDMQGSTLADPSVEQCVLSEVRGIRYPDLGSRDRLAVEHTFRFAMPERAFGARRTCSAASRLPLSRRIRLWRERIRVLARSDAYGLINAWQQAERSCELNDWRARRLILKLIMQHCAQLSVKLEVYAALESRRDLASYLRWIILRDVRSLAEVEMARTAFGISVPLDWRVFGRDWRRADTPERKLRLVRRWLEVAPDEMDLRLRLLALLEETESFAEARRLARALRSDPLADARVRTAVGEFWMRQSQPEEGRRVFSEIVERTPRDPWARHRLGDLYRAHGWADAAYQEYLNLSQLRSGDAEVLLLLSRAAADAGRVDESLRMAQRLSESTEPGMHEGIAGHARLWNRVRLARLFEAADSDQRRADIRRRVRTSGSLRHVSALFVALTWEHPDERPTLHSRFPESDDADPWQVATLGGAESGIWVERIMQREDGDYLFEIRRDAPDDLRNWTVELLIVVDSGAATERIIRQPVSLTRSQSRVRFSLTSENELEQVAIPVRERG